MTREWGQPNSPREARVHIQHCSINHYRGFDNFAVAPREHVLLVEEPRSGRSDRIAAPSKVFEVT